jgi:1-deoxy-D-xylulose-5-phosphate reductoisomerase
VQPLREVDGAELVPVDSEHCALHQCLRSSIDTRQEVSRLVLTASGGPFRGRSSAELANVTVDEALRHPTWSMGPKITIDSSTLMNKGLEVIEAHELFGTAFDEIDVVVHPQSVVHSMVEFTDGSTIAQLSMPDMRLPIGYALGWPHRLGTPFGTIDWTQLSQLNFEPPDRSTFKCLDLAYAAGRAGGTAPAVISAANEIAVDAFINGEITWAQIHDVSAAVLDATALSQPSTVDEVIDADRRAREDARRVISGMLA